MGEKGEEHDGERIPARSRPDLWGGWKDFGHISPTEEDEAWRKTLTALDGLSAVADGLMLEPLILALSDALGRSKEELRRAEGRVERSRGEGSAKPETAQRRDYVALDEKTRHIRLRKQWRQVELAKAAGLSEGQTSRIENDKHTPQIGPSTG